MMTRLAVPLLGSSLLALACRDAGPTPGGPAAPALAVVSSPASRGATSGSASGSPATGASGGQPASGGQAASGGQPASATRPAPTSLTATRLVAGLAGAPGAALTLLRTEPDHRAVLVNEDTGEFTVAGAQDEGADVLLRGLDDGSAGSQQETDAALTIRLPEGKKDGALRWALSREAGRQGATMGQHLPATVTTVTLPLRAAPLDPGLRSSSTGPSRFVGADGSFTDAAVAEGAPLSWRGRSRAGGAIRLWHHERWLVLAPSPSAPRGVLVGGQPLQPVEQAPGRERGCLVHGVAPAIEGALAEPLRRAWQDWVGEQCRAAGAGAILELSYGLITLVGINLPDFGRVDDPSFRPGPSRSPSSTTIVPINLRARVTTEAGSQLVEEALLLDTGSSTLPRLSSLVKQPEGAEALVREGLTELSARAGWLPSALRREVVTEGCQTLTVGPTTIDVVVPRLPFGLVLPSRHVMIGPRSTLAGAFTRSAATSRLTAALYVDY